MPTARTLQDQVLMRECKNLRLQNRAGSETIPQREKWSQDYPGKPHAATLQMQQIQCVQSFLKGKVGIGEVESKL